MLVDLPRGEPLCARCRFRAACNVGFVCVVWQFPASFWCFCAGWEVLRLYVEGGTSGSGGISSVRDVGFAPHAM